MRRSPRRRAADYPAADFPPERGRAGLARVGHGEERVLAPRPFFRMNALAVSTPAMILSAGCVVQLDRFHPKSWWRDVVDSGATIVHYLGVMPAILMNLPDQPTGHRVRFGYGAN